MTTMPYTYPGEYMDPAILAEEDGDELLVEWDRESWLADNNVNYWVAVANSHSQDEQIIESYDPVMAQFKRFLDEHDLREMIL